MEGVIAKKECEGAMQEGRDRGVCVGEKQEGRDGESKGEEHI